MRRTSSFGFRRFGFRRNGRYNRRRYWNSRRRRQYPLYRSMRSTTNKSLIRLGGTANFTVFQIAISVNSTRFYQVIDWSRLSSSLDFQQYRELYSTFIPVYFKVKWVSNIQSNASGYYIPGGVSGNPPTPYSPITYNLTDGFATTRYDNVADPINTFAGTQYTSFKTFNPSRSWRTIVYPRRNQMTAPRQQFDAYVDTPAITDTIRGMGRLWIQGVVQWEDSNNVVGPPSVLYPPVAIQQERMGQLGQLYYFFYCRVYDRK